MIVAGDHDVNIHRLLQHFVVLIVECVGQHDDKVHLVPFGEVLPAGDILPYGMLVPGRGSLAAGSAAYIALPIALAASTAMCLPIATPPNALVFSTGRLASREFLKIGIPMGLIAPGAMVAWVWWIVPRVLG